MDAQRTLVAARKAEFDRLRPRLGGAMRGLEQFHDPELTYSSNALEGNTLSAAEAALVLYRRLDATLAEYLEAGHQALDCNADPAADRNAPQH